MNRGRNTLILLVIGAALGAYVYFVEMKRPSAADAAVETKAKLFGANVDSSKIDELRLKSSSGDRTTLKKSGGTWQIVEPMTSAVDESEVSSITSNISTIEPTRTVDDKPKDLAPYGLAEPRVELEFKGEGDKGSHTLLIGTKTPTGGDLYAKLANESKVVLIPAFLEGTFDRTTFQLRDKTIVKFDRDKVDSIEITEGATTMAFEKKSDIWTLTKPWPAKTDSAAVDALISRIASGQMKSLAAQAPADTELAQYGLAKPDVHITLGVGSTRTSLLIGKASGVTASALAGAAAAATAGTPAASMPPVPGAAPGAGAGLEAGGDGTYAKDGSRSIVFTIDKALADDLKKSPSDYRIKEIFSFREFDGNKIEVTRAAGNVVIEKKKEPAKKDAAGKETEPASDKWVLTQPPPAKPVEDAKLSDVAAKIAGLRADTFVDKLPAGSAQLMTVTTQFNENKKSEKVVVYKAGADYYAIRENDPGAAKLTAIAAEDLVKALDAAK